jgi:hypothetical protein
MRPGAAAQGSGPARHLRQRKISIWPKQGRSRCQFGDSGYQARIDEARSKRKKFEAEAEFYKKKTFAGQELPRDCATLDHEIKASARIAEHQETGISHTIKAKYDADRKRYARTDGKASAVAPAPSQAAASTAALINQSVFAAAGR